MKKTGVRACLAAGVTLALLAAAERGSWAQDAPGTQDKPAAPATRGAPPSRGGGGGGGPTNVEGAMKGMGRALRGLKDSIADAGKREQNLAAINDMQRNCVIAKGMPLPADVQKKITDPAERAKLGATYRADLMKLLHELLALEQSVLDGKADQAKAQLDAVIKLRDSGHTTMGVED